MLPKQCEKPWTVSLWPRVEASFTGTQGVGKVCG